MQLAAIAADGPHRDNKYVSRHHKCRACRARITHFVQMRTINMTPGLSAWDLRRRNRRRHWRNRAILLLGLSGAVLYALPPALNPLVHAGILALQPAVQEVPIARVTLAIPVRQTDLPKRRPSLADARNTDQIEAAHVTGVMPSLVQDTLPTVVEETSAVPADLNQSGAGEPMHALISMPGELQPTAALPTPRRITPPVQAPALPPAAPVVPDEDIAALRKRVFNTDR
jgi:hypothetical protein